MGFGSHAMAPLLTNAPTEYNPAYSPHQLGLIRN